MIAGGGTAGHLSPGIAVAERLVQQEPEVAVDFACSARDLDAQMLGGAGFDYHPLPAAPFPYGCSLRAVVSAGCLLRSLARAWRLVRRLRPQVVLGVGGHVSVPVVLAARLQKVPVAVHVLDAHPDRANLLVARWARWITLAFPEAAQHFPAERTEFTGCPVRRAILEASRNRAQELLGLDPARLTVLVTGGSQGARRINEAVVGALPELLGELKVQVVHLTGAADFERVAQESGPAAALHGHYHPLPFTDDIGPLLAAADLVVGRAGSSSVAEARVRGRPQILVPYPHAGRHQLANARSLEAAGCAVVIPNEECTPATLARQIRALVEDEPRRQEMSRLALRSASPHAAERIAAGLLALARGDRPQHRCR